MISIFPVHGLPEIGRGDDLGGLICGAIDVADGDVIVVSQKVVSKAEGAVVAPPPGTDPTVARRGLAREQAARVVADAPSVLIVQTRHGFVCANAGIDASNSAGMLTLLPEDPDRSAADIRRRIAHVAGVAVGVIVADTFGRPWRMGQTDVAIGVAGLEPLRDERGSADRDGNILEVTEIAVADELAAAADLVRDKAAGVPVVVVRGFALRASEDAGARALVRPAEADLFLHGRGMLARRLVADDLVAADAAPVAAHDVDVVRRLAPDVAVANGGRGTTFTSADAFRGGLLAAALVDLGYAVEWSAGPPAVVTAGVAATRR